MAYSRKKVSRRVMRHIRLRKKMSGTTERPRLAVFRSNQHIYAQLIDDSAGHTLVAASTLDPDLKDQASGDGKIDGATAVGTSIAQKAKDAGVERVVFDRGGYAYHGRVKALAEAAREVGLEF
ncbi:MAG: 50S ribosomal protein L18 [Chloroflexi bacterium]|jgi:large subunit ribosomal protein L18|nr:50S ribosomal protein L18 [Chloroflexota bacterium]MBT4073263.1 50S ribosomal protein L18 [Chloroflexota bacterium]MBT4516191.1 50S ribosomal protein L18 [Chloroflexota bacterium]MBT6682023.1 50S ribosomal protein L18 [Chloroflexota bacterium]